MLAKRSSRLLQQSIVKYIALLAMVKIVPTHPHLIADYQDEILQSLDDEDVSIRMRALELISSMVRYSYITSCNAG